MPDFTPSIPEDLQQWALQQQLFFIASAPLAGRHVNVSPKGLPASTLTIFDANTVGYIDATGSGIETISHVYENGRATIMFCSFDAHPRIMRWFCTGRVIEWDSPEFESMFAKTGKSGIAGARAIIIFHVWKVQTSCGWGVPTLNMQQSPEHDFAQSYFEDRKTLSNWLENAILKKGKVEAMQLKYNLRSLDGCAGLQSARKQAGEAMLLEDVQIYVRRLMVQWEAMLAGALLAVVALLMLRTVGRVLPLRAVAGGHLLA